MPLLLDKLWHKNVRTFVWKIDESSDCLWQGLDVKYRNAYQEKLNHIGSEKRRCEWIVSKVIVHNIADIAAKVEYDKDGKPFLLGDKRTLSISHSGEYVFVSVAFQDIGVDVQKKSEKLLRISAAFLSQAEKELNKSDLNLLLLVWSTKEAVYKLCGYKYINLKDDVSVNVYQVNSFGFCIASIKSTTKKGIIREDYNISAEIRYLFYNDYIFVVAI